MHNTEKKICVIDHLIHLFLFFTYLPKQNGLNIVVLYIYILNIIVLYIIFRTKEAQTNIIHDNIHLVSEKKNKLYQD